MGSAYKTPRETSNHVRRSSGTDGMTHRPVPTQLPQLTRGRNAETRVNEDSIFLQNNAYPQKNMSRRLFFVFWKKLTSDELYIYIMEYIYTHHVNMCKHVNICKCTCTCTYLQTIYTHIYMYIYKRILINTQLHINTCMNITKKTV